MAFTYLLESMFCKEDPYKCLPRVLKVSSNLGLLEFIFLQHEGHYPCPLWSAMAQIIWIISPSFRTLNNAVSKNLIL